MPYGLSAATKFVAGTGQQVVAAAGIRNDGEHRPRQLGVKNVTLGDVDCAVEADGVGNPELLCQIGTVVGNEVADLPAFQIDDAQGVAALDLMRDVPAWRERRVEDDLARHGPGAHSDSPVCIASPLADFQELEA
jgi:hypothetical protein